MACGSTHHTVISLHCVQCNRMSPLIITALCYRNFRLRRDCGRWRWLQYTSRWDLKANQASLKSTHSLQPHFSFLIKNAFLTFSSSFKTLWYFLPLSLSSSISLLFSCSLSLSLSRRFLTLVPLIFLFLNYQYFIVVFNY